MEGLVISNLLEYFEDGLYQISVLTRGENGTEDIIDKHAINYDYTRF